MPFLRLTRDRRGYENTYLLHAVHPDERPRVLYWYRTAPAVRVGRPALDEDAIRTIEEQHPDVDFEWSEILAVSEVLSAEVEESPAPRKRRARSPRPAAVPGRRSAPPQAPAADTEPAPKGEVAAAEPGERAAAEWAPAEETRGQAHDLLESLVGREIATRLHARFAELHARIGRLTADESARARWRARVDALDPDLWVTPDEVLSGVQRADAEFDALRREMLEGGGV